MIVARKKAEQEMRQGARQYRQVAAGFSYVSAGDSLRNQAGSSHGFQTANQMLVDMYEDTTGMNKGKNKVSNQHDSITSNVQENAPSNVIKDKDQGQDAHDPIVDVPSPEVYGVDNPIVVDSQDDGNVNSTTTSPQIAKRVKTNKSVSGR